MKTRYFIITAIAVIAIAILQFLLNYPTNEQIKNKIESILIQPDLCSNSNAEVAKTLESMKLSSQNFHLKEKINAMPKRIDYYIEDSDGTVIAELAYGVDGGCQGISVKKIIR